MRISFFERVGAGIRRMDVAFRGRGWSPHRAAPMHVNRRGFREWSKVFRAARCGDRALRRKVSP
jgi:hypothetical protein